MNLQISTDSTDETVPLKLRMINKRHGSLFSTQEQWSLKFRLLSSCNTNNVRKRFSGTNLSLPLHIEFHLKLFEFLNLINIIQSIRCALLNFGPKTSMNRIGQSINSSRWCWCMWEVRLVPGSTPVYHQRQRCSMSLSQPHKFYDHAKIRIPISDIVDKTIILTNRSS